MRGIKKNMKLSKGALKAIEMLNNAGYEAYAVGGCVRDAIMDIEINDFDVTTSATPEEMQQIFKNERTYETGIKHGTITLVYENENVEITTYRVDGEYEDNRRPKAVEFTKSLTNDLKRRDFTMNAIVYNNNEGYIDLFGGIEDIKNKTIRAIGNPKDRFNEDALRILRAIRFASKLGFEIEESTKKAMLECKHLLHNISEERIAAEINKFVLGSNVKKAILDHYDILSEIIPEFEAMHNFDQKNDWHVYDVLTHTAVVVENTPQIAHLRLTALLHDTGKVHTFTVDEKGIGHFYGHNDKSAEITENYLTKYKYDNFTKERVYKLVKVHDTPIEPDRILIKKRINRMGKDCFFDLIKIKRADNLAQNLNKVRLDIIDEIEKIATDIINEDCFTLGSLKINGGDLIKNGFKPGKQLGNILNTLLEEVMEEKIPNEKEALLNRARNLSEAIQ